LWGAREPRNAQAIEKSVQAAGELGAEVIAEGIETPEMVARMRSFGVGYLQGYFFGKPSPAMFNVTEDLLRLVQNIGERERVEAELLLP